MTAARVAAVHAAAARIAGDHSDFWHNGGPRRQTEAP